MTGVYFDVGDGHPLLAVSRTARVQYPRLRPLLLILDPLMLLRQLHLGNGGRLHAALAHLVIIIILHVVRLHCLIWLIALRGLLLNIIVLQVRILYYYLFAFLLNDLLLRFLLRLRLIL